MRHIVKVGLAVVRECRILMVRKHSGPSFILPGGKPKSGEKDIDALERELDEELGCALETAEYLGDFSAPAADLVDTTVTVRLYRGEITGEPVAQAEIAELRWIDMTSPEVSVAPSLSGKILPFLMLASGSTDALLVTAAGEGSSTFNPSVFERATEIMAQWLARFRDDDAAITENDLLTAGHLAGALAANDLLVADLPAQLVEKRPQPSQKAMTACARWLAYCLSIGWSKDDLDHLEKRWWKYHDDHGRLLMGPGVKPRDMALQG